VSESWVAAASADCTLDSKSSEAVLGVDSNGVIALWERRVEQAGNGFWSSGKLIMQVKEVGRVYSACMLAGSNTRNPSAPGGGGRHWIMLCGSDRACVVEIASRCKSIVQFCALSLQVKAKMIMNYDYDYDYEYDYDYDYDYEYDYDDDYDYDYDYDDDATKMQNQANTNQTSRIDKHLSLPLTSRSLLLKPS
jgi:hypothetical protein